MRSPTPQPLGLKPRVCGKVVEVLAHEFSVRLKVISRADSNCETYTKLSRHYAGSGHSMKSFKYGPLTRSPESDKTGNIYKVTSILHSTTEVLLKPSRQGSPDEHSEEQAGGVLIPGYVLLAVALFMVVLLAVIAKTCMEFKKEGSHKDIFHASPPKRRKRRAKVAPEGDSSTKQDDSTKPEKPSGMEEERCKLRSEPYHDFCKEFSKETHEELALLMAKSRKSDEMMDDPVSTSEFLFYLHRLSRIAIDYYDDPTTLRVSADINPGFLYRSMPRLPPETPDRFAAICSDLNKKILPGMTHWQHPRFYAYYPAGRAYPDVLAEVLTSAMAFSAFSWTSCPSLNELEHIVVNWIGRAFGLPESFLFQGNPKTSTGGGTILESASDAIFCAVLVSRNWKINQIRTEQKQENVVKYETVYDITKKLVVYCSRDAHSGIEKACKVAMVRCRPIQPLPENKWGITGSQLESCILKDLENGLIPTHIHVTLGTSSTGADDQLDSIWPVAKKYQLWIHCDASYSGNAWLDAKYRTNATALPHVHSINVNLHKFLLFSGMSCLVWTRKSEDYKEAFKSQVFQKAATQGLGSTDIREWGIHRSRRNKSLKIWMSLRLNGLKGLRYHLNNVVEMCGYFESLVATHPLLKIFSRNLSIFTFYYQEPGNTREENNLHTENLCHFINQSHKLFFSHTKVHDIDLIRVSICYERTNAAMIDASWTLLKSLVDEFTRRKTDPYLLHTSMAAPQRPVPKPFRPHSVEYLAISPLPRETGKPLVRVLAGSRLLQQPKAVQHNCPTPARAISIRFVTFCDFSRVSLCPT
ncbi:hypothetical protein Q1695_015993 [Nippostrongylus brasiliensis]|nr:hypothetical protein Q1695_015993 [Nippostrongylus brasiliensis]